MFLPGSLSFAAFAAAFCLWTDSLAEHDLLVEDIFGAGAIEGKEMHSALMRLEGLCRIVDLVEEQSTGLGGRRDHVELPAALLVGDRAPGVLADQLRERVLRTGLDPELDGDDEVGVSIRIAVHQASRRGCEFKKCAPS